MSNPSPVTLFETPYVALKTHENWAYASRVKGHGAVGIIAITPENKVILVEQFRIPHNRMVIELPAGLIADENPETPLEAAKKELWEETGYTADTIQAFGNPVSSSAGLSDETIQLFVATGLTKAGEGGGLESENITVHEVPLPELFAWLMEQQAAGKITDPKTMAIPGILQYLGVGSTPPLPLRSIHLTVGDIRKATEGLPDELDIYCQAGNNDLGNIWSPHSLDKSTHGFFGQQIPCLLINHSRRDSEKNIIWRAGLPEDDEPEEV